MAGTCKRSWHGHVVMSVRTTIECRREIVFEKRTVPSKSAALRGLRCRASQSIEVAAKPSTSTTRLFTAFSDSLISLQSQNHASYLKSPFHHPSNRVHCPRELAAPARSLHPRHDEEE